MYIARRFCLGSSHAPSGRRFFDQFVEPFESRLFLLRADDPPVQGLAIRGRLRLKELPRGLISF